MIVIQRFDRAHLPAVAAIEAVTFTDPWSREAYEHELTNPLARYLVVLEDGDVCGYAGFWKVLDEGQITNVAIKGSKRGKGLGKQLMNALIALAKQEGITAMTLEVRVSNHPAIRLYESLGFRKAGVRPHFYPDGEDAFIYWLEEL